MWGCPKEKTGGKGKILFLDSEETSSKTYDSKLFALIFLISSLLIHNSNSNIDESGLSELSLATQLSSSISANVNLKYKY
jgi:hypothetical protein